MSKRRVVFFDDEKEVNALVVAPVTGNRFDSMSVLDEAHSRRCVCRPLLRELVADWIVCFEMKCHLLTMHWALLPRSRRSQRTATTTGLKLEIIIHLLVELLGTHPLRFCPPRARAVSLSPHRHSHVSSFIAPSYARPLHVFTNQAISLKLVQELNEPE